jgi:hypothetical protein
LAAAARRIEVELSELFEDAAIRHENGREESSRGFDKELAKAPASDALDILIYHTGLFAAPNQERPKLISSFKNLVRSFINVVIALELDFREIVDVNLRKIDDYFGPPNWDSLPDFADAPVDECLPRSMQVRFVTRSNGQTHIQISGVYIGDPLDDNIADEDFYRLHDVFHLANAFVLGWSPVFRALLKRKRKSTPAIDATEDSGRAIVIEEAIVAYVFSQAKDYNWFNARQRIPLDILKVVRLLTKGYEAASIPLWAWSEAILQGFDAFRSLKDTDGTGVVICDADRHSITVSELP